MAIASGRSGPIRFPAVARSPIQSSRQFANMPKPFLMSGAFAGPAQLDLTGNGTAIITRAEIVSGDYFQTLGVQAAAGRTIEPSDERPGAEAVAVLSYAYWQGAFGGAQSAIGKSIKAQRRAVHNRWRGGRGLHAADARAHTRYVAAAFTDCPLAPSLGTRDARRKKLVAHDRRTAEAGNPLGHASRV